MTKLKLAICSLLICSCLSVAAIAQGSSEVKTSCVSSSDAVQITFDHIETVAVANGKAINTFWLRLRNNSKCGIEIEVPESVGGLLGKQRIARDQNGQFIKNANGGLQIERVSTIEIKNGDKVPVIHNLTNSRQKSIGAGNLEGCIVYTPTVQPGQEILFSVNSSLFKKNHSLEVAFNYTGEKPIPLQPPQKRKTVFSFNDIPKEAIKATK